MMASLIFIFSVAALMQFFVSYCRSLIAASARRALSSDVQDVIGIRRSASGEDFDRVMQYLRLCPDRREDRNGIKAIGAYFRLLGSFATGLDRIGTFAVRLLCRRGVRSSYRAQPGYVRRTDVRIIFFLLPRINHRLLLLSYSKQPPFFFGSNKFPVIFSCCSSPRRSGCVRSAKTTGE
jgi:hypothetical protein